MTALRNDLARWQAGEVGRAKHREHADSTITNPRERRLLSALMSGPLAREALDRAVGASNSPDVVLRLRRRGFEVPCELRDGLDRDGRKCKYGVYRLTGNDADLATRLLMQGE
jgi:hypothetical protein